jgi:phosphatidylserine decarboxylase
MSHFLTVAQGITYRMSSISPFILFQHIVPQRGLSRLVGVLAASRIGLVKNTFIKTFANHYKIDMSLAAEENLTAYDSFNDFFTRLLKNGVRDIDSAVNSVVSPADGAISQLGRIVGDDVFQAKGQSFSVSKLIGDAALAAPFTGGEFATVYLSPRDYHRVHMPFSGRLTDTLYIPGELFSVNVVTAQNVAGLFARNERMVCLFDTTVGRMAVVLVGAMIVAGIETVATGKVNPTGHIEHRKHDLHLDKGAELGRFYLGSTAVVLFQPNKMTWLESLVADSSVEMGKAIGALIESN